MKIQIGDQTHDLNRITVKEAERIEAVTGMTYSEAMASRSVKALRAVAFIALRRENPALRYDDVDFALDDFELIGDDAEDPTEPEATPTSE